MDMGLATPMLVSVSLIFSMYVSKISGLILAKIKKWSYSMMGLMGTRFELAMTFPSTGALSLKLALKPVSLDLTRTTHQLLSSDSPLSTKP